MSEFWSDIVHQLSPYIPGEQPKIGGLIKLNTNESPFGPSPKAIAAVKTAASEALRLYPDPQSTALRDALAHYHKVKPEQVFVGNGSDEVLAHAFAALLKHANPLRFPDITYSFYPVYCRLYGIEPNIVPLDGDMRVCVDDYLDDAGPVIIPNPNAPTGIALPQSEIARLAASRSESVVIIDEAYIDFGGESAIALIKDHPNLLVVQTMSKSRALAGLRIGYAIGDASLIEGLTRVKDSFNSYPLARTAQAAAVASLEDEAYFRECCDQIIANREAMTEQLEALGFTVLPSSANFVFAKHANHDGKFLADALREQAIVVRHFAKPRTDAYLRITVGTEQQIDRLIEALRKIIA